MATEDADICSFIITSNIVQQLILLYPCLDMHILIARFNPMSNLNLSLKLSADFLQQIRY